jgi:O-antigen ligase
MLHEQHHRASRTPRSDPREQMLLRTVDAALAGVVFVLPFCMGGRQAIGQLLLVVLAVLAAVAWTARQAVAPDARWRSTAAQWLLLAVTLLVAVQIIPLSETWLMRLSPEIPDLLPLWMSSAGQQQIGSWNQLSLTPQATRDGLVQWLAYAALFLVAVQRITSLAHVERLLRWIAWSAAAMACFGLIQYLASNGKFFWVYQHPFIGTTDCVRGAFTNRNHFAHFLALGLGPLLWWMQSSWKRAGAETSLRVGLAVLMLGVVLFAALMSFSRGGAVALMTAGVAYFTVAWRASLLSRRFVLAGAGLCVLVVAMLLVHGYQGVAGRLDDLTSGSLEQLDPSQGRRKVWTAVTSAIVDFPLLGTGVGSHIEIYHRYFDEPSWTEYTHAESGYLQVAEETGLAGIALLATGIAFCGAWCCGAWRQRGSKTDVTSCLAAIVASLAASLIHSLYDFVWYVPSCTALIALLAGCAFHLCRLTRTTAATAKPLLGWAWAGACCVLLMAGTSAAMGRWGAVRAEPHGDEYRIAGRGVNDPRAQADRMLKHFSAMAAHDPDDARSQLALAEACLRQFDLAQRASENPMSLTAIRDAALAGGFADRAQLAGWLDRALGQRRTWLDKALWHTRRSLELCPLQGQGYLYLAELAFLEQTDRDRPRALIAQALAVRPHDGSVLFKAGEEAALAGDIDGAAD